MVKANTKHNHEIDLVELFLTIWAGKWIIIGCTTVSLGVAGIYLALVEPKYESKIIIKQNIIPPFLVSINLTSAPAPALAPAIDDFIDSFYSQKIFSDWAKNSKNKHLTSTLRFSEFTATRNQSTELVISSGDSELIDAHFQYASFINRFLTQSYQASSKEELIFLKEQAKEFGSYPDQIVYFLLNTNRFLKDAENGELVLDLKNPTQPVKISPKMELVLALSAVLGGFVGCASAIFTNLFRKRKFESAISASFDS